MCFFLAFALAGCGGGGDSAPASSTTNVRTTIDWAARTRGISAPASASSVIITLKDALDGGGDVHFVENRSADPTAHSESYTSIPRAKVGSWLMSAQFFAQNDGSGDLVATAGAIVDLKSDGSGIPSIAFTGLILSVAVTANQSVLIGTDSDLSVLINAPINSSNVTPGTGGSNSPLNVYGNTTAKLIAVSPAAIVWEVDSGSDKLQFVKGMAHGLATGSATVTASIDGKKSDPMSVNVVASIVSKIPLPSNGIVYSKLTNRLYASVSGSYGVNGNSIAIIDPATKAIEAFVPVGSEPSLLTISRDGSVLYTWLKGSKRLIRFDTASRKVVASFPILDGPEAVNYDISAIAIAPNDTKRIAVIRYSILGGSRFIIIYNDNNPLVNGFQVDPAYGGSSLAYSITFGADDSRLYLNSNGDSRVTALTVDSAGLKFLLNYPTASNFGESSILYDSSRLYQLNGRVLNAETGVPIGLLPSIGASNQVGGIFISPVSSLSRAVTLSSSNYYLGTLNVYNTDSFQLLSSQDIASLISGYKPTYNPITSMTYSGGKSVAMTDGANVYILNSVPGF